MIGTLDETPRPLVSVGVPVFNGERFLARALDLLAAQTFSDYELIIIDNGSTDRTAQICDEYRKRDHRIRYIRHERTVRVVENFMRAFAQARGTYFLWNAADDERPPDAIERTLKVFRDRPDTVMVHGPVELNLVQEGRVVVVDNAMDLTAADAAARVAALTRGLRHNGMLYGVYRREVLARVRFRQHAGQDFLVCLQMALLGSVEYVPAPLVRYRHVYGPIDDPMYELEPLGLKNLLADWGTRRHKCFETMVRGVWYLLAVQGVGADVRVAAALAHVRAFSGRYWRHLLSEVVFVVSTPAAWLAWPIIRAKQKLRQARAASHLAS